MTPKRNPQEFRYQALALTLGPISMMDVTYSSDTDIVVDGIDGYALMVPLRGALEFQYGGTRVTANRDRAVSFQPGRRMLVNRWSGGTQIVAIKIKAEYVEAAARRMFGDDITAPITAGPLPHVTDSRMRSFIQLARTVNSNPGIVENPLVAEPMIESILSSFLVATCRRESPATVAAISRNTPKVVVRSVEFIEQNAATPLTVSDIASNSQVSVRALQTSFARHLGTSPMAYLRDVRLRRAHLELRHADPTTTNVAQIAQRWGFTHLGRFSSSYRSLYGRLPSQTLRQTS